VGEPRAGVEPSECATGSVSPCTQGGHGLTGRVEPLFCQPALPDLIGSSTNILWTCVVFAFDEARPGVTEPEGDVG